MVCAYCLRAMQVTERHVVRAGENVGRHGFDTADEAAQGALASSDIAAIDEGMRHHDPSCANRHMGAGRGDLDAEDILGTRDPVIREGFACGELVAEWDGGDRDRAMGV